MPEFSNTIKAAVSFLFLLMSLLSFSQEDTIQVNIFLKQTMKTRRADPDSAFFYATKAIVLAEKLDYKHGLVMAYTAAGLAQVSLNHNADALAYLSKAIALSKITGDQKLVADAYFYTNQVYRYMGNYGMCISTCFKALSIYESIKDYEGVANCYNGIANVYYDQQNHEKALEYFLKTASILDHSSESNKSVVYLNLGMAYSDVKKFDSAMFYFGKSLSIREKRNDKYAIADVFINMGVTYSSRGDYDKALEYLFKAKEIYTDKTNRYYMGIILTNIGDVYLQKKNYKESELNLKEGLVISEQIDDKEGIKIASNLLAQLYSEKKDFEKAWFYGKKYISVKDSLSSLKNLNQIQDIETKYETDKLDREIELLNKDKELKESIIEKQNAQRIAFVTGIVLLIGISFFIYRGYNQKKKDNEIITKQKEEVEKQNHIIEEQKKDVEEKQKDILDSIYYAQRIQKTLLPAEKFIEKSLKRLKAK
ncbi:MAG: yrrB 5 [Bacteroidetes bacterium]|jgi:tetratricopeptide (TPR) repeat protein|nr:yrrB 5 [Bacteroidota bacterium]